MIPRTSLWRLVRWWWRCGHKRLHAARLRRRRAGQPFSALALIWGEATANVMRRMSAGVPGASGLASKYARRASSPTGPYARSCSGATDEGM